MRTEVAVDPITIEVVGNALQSITEEMGAVMVRTAYSTGIKERRDCSCCLFDAQARLVAQAAHVPAHLGAMRGLVREIVERERALADGDLFIANDPYHGGSHVPDVTVVMPVFFQGELCGFTANTGHHGEVGGAGTSNVGNARSVYEEGLRIPPIRLYAGGVLREDLLYFILTNTKVKEERNGDFRSHIATARYGRRRMLEVLEKYGRDTVLACMEKLFDYSEQKIREGISQIPDGVYDFTDWMDDDGVTEDPIPFHVRVTVAGSEMAFDFSGTGAAAGATNSVWDSTLTSVYHAVRVLIGGNIPPNEGCFRPITMTIPEGCILNPREPSATGARADTNQRVVDVIMGALAAVLPDRIPAASAGAVNSSGILGRTARGRPYAWTEAMAGGVGGRPDRDGANAMHMHMTNTANQPVEVAETEYPLFIECYQLVPDSGGPGRFRGGLGLHRDIRVLPHGVPHTPMFLPHTDRQTTVPWGLAGGRPGKPGRSELNPGQPNQRRLTSKRGAEMAPGDLLRLITQGGGGHGDPLERPPRAVLEDVIDGYVTLESAERDYGVVIDPDRLQVDEAATRARRASLSSARCRGEAAHPDPGAGSE